jgi:hypothetical protein
VLTRYRSAASRLRSVILKCVFRSASLLAVLVLTSACGASSAGPPPTPTAQPSSTASPAPLGGGSLAKQAVTRGAGPFYVSFVELIMPATAANEEAAFLVVMRGAAQVQMGDGAARTIAAGQAVALAPRTSWTARESPSAEAWLVSVRPSARRTEPAPPTQRRVYDSPDFPTAPLPAGRYDDELVLLALVPGRELQPHSHGGIEAMLALAGRLDLRVKGKPVHALTARVGDAVDPDTALAGRSSGAETSYSLVILATPEGKAVQSPAEAP